MNATEQMLSSGVVVTYLEDTDEYGFRLEDEPDAVLLPGDVVREVSAKVMWRLVWHKLRKGTDG